MIIPLKPRYYNQLGKTGVVTFNLKENLKLWYFQVIATQNWIIGAKTSSARYYSGTNKCLLIWFFDQLMLN